MKKNNFSTFFKPLQMLISFVSVIAVSAICFFLSDLINHQIVALILMLTISIIAMVMDIVPVLTAAILSSLILNFFFIPPLFTLRIVSAEDSLIFLMYFMIALINGVLTYKIRQTEKAAREQKEKEKTIHLYNTLLNSLSHEMRTPLSAIIGAVDTLKENKSQLTEDNREELYSELEEAGFRLNRQVENLLNMSRLESGTIRLKRDWCDLNDLVNSVLRKHKRNAGGHILQSAVRDNLPLFSLDSGLMETVLDNLVQNSIQHTPAGSIIRIEADLKDEQCCIVVSDNGPGFPEEQIAQVFEKFYRLPQTKTGGTGLGLSIARGFTEAHNGTIVLRNNSNGGASFIILIPAEKTFISNLKNE